MATFNQVASDLAEAIEKERFAKDEIERLLLYFVEMVSDIETEDLYQRNLRRARNKTAKLLAGLDQLLVECRDKNTDTESK